MKQFSEASGIQGFSTPQSSLHYIIFAANAHRANYVNAFLTYTFQDRAGFTFKPMIGAYKGVTENSWLILASDWDLVKMLCLQEESILYLSKVNSRNHRKADLIFLSGDASLTDCNQVDLGWLVEVSKAEALAQDGYSQDFCIDQSGKLISHYWTAFQLDKFNNPIK